MGTIATKKARLNLLSACVLLSNPGVERQTSIISVRKFRIFIGRKRFLSIVILFSPPFSSKTKTIETMYSLVGLIKRFHLLPEQKKRSFKPAGYWGFVRAFKMQERWNMFDLACKWKRVFSSPNGCHFQHTGYPIWICAQLNSKKIAESFC